MLQKHLLWYRVIDSDWTPENHLTPLGWLVSFLFGLAVLYGIAFAAAGLN